MSEITYLTDDYCQDQINRKIKFQIETLFFGLHERRPTKEEYLFWFDKFCKKAKCIVTNADIGVYDDDETQWYQEAK